MSIEEPNAYSRNLFIVSMGFILYYYLDLEPLRPDNLNLLMNPFKVHNNTLYHYLPWIALIWTWVSFFVHTFGKYTSEYIDFFKNRFKSYLATNNPKYDIRSAILNSAKQKQNVKAALKECKHEGRLLFSVDPIIHTTAINKIHTSANFIIKSDGSPDRPINENIEINWKYFFIYHRNSWLRFITTNPATITYFLPHIIAVWAFVCGILEYNDTDTLLSLCVHFPLKE